MAHTIAEILRTRVIETDMSARKLAELTGVKQQSISAFLRGGDLSLPSTQKLCDYFGMILVSKDWVARKFPESTVEW